MRKGASPSKRVKGAVAPVFDPAPYREACVVMMRAYLEMESIRDRVNHSLGGPFVEGRWPTPLVKPVFGGIDTRPEGEQAEQLGKMNELFFSSCIPTCSAGPLLEKAYDDLGGEPEGMEAYWDDAENYKGRPLAVGFAEAETWWLHRTGGDATTAVRAMWATRASYKWDGRPTPSKHLPTRDLGRTPGHTAAFLRAAIRGRDGLEGLWKTSQVPRIREMYTAFLIFCPDVPRDISDQCFEAYGHVMLLKAWLA